MKTLSGIRLWGFIALFTSFIASTYGFGIYLFPAIAPEMIKDIRFTYAEMGITTGFVQAGFLFFALVSGLLTNKVGAFRIIKTSVLLCTLSLLGMIWANNFLVISLLLILMGGCAASVWVPMVEVCQKYISPNHQARALGLMSSGTSYGVFTNSILISFTLNDLGWRFIWIATFIIVALIYLCAFFIFRAIERHEAEVDSQSTSAQATSIPFLEKIRNLPRKTTAIIMLMMFLNGLSCMPFQTYLSSLLVGEHGLNIEQSASAWRLIGFVGMFGGFLIGWVADRITVRWTLLIVYLLLGQSTAILLYAEITPVSIYASSALFGLSFYAIFGLVPAYISHVYKNNTAALVFAFGNIALGLGGILGNTAGGWIKQATNTFERLYLIILFAAIGSAVLSIVMRSEKLD